MSKIFVHRWGVFPLWLLLTLAVFFRTPTPIDETRYLSVAWDMWLRNDFLVPYLNGHPYSHKPPLLFWLFQMGWGIFGVNEYWARLVGPFCALGNLLLVRHLGHKIWPEHLLIALKAPWILSATLLWTLFAGATMFDTLLTNCVLLGMIGLYEAAIGGWFKGWVCFAFAVGLGLLAKGPVIFIHLLPTALLVFLWDKSVVDYKKWYVCLLLASLAGVAMALIWALPAALSGGAEYADAIFWHQTVDRTVSSKIHARSFGWYFWFLPILIFPWIVWPRLWQNAKLASINQDKGLRFCLVWLLVDLLLFSLLPSKQVHYLLPLLPAYALICTRVLCYADRSRRLSLELLPVFVIGLVGVFLVLLPNLPVLSDLNWVRAVKPFWGVSVILISLFLGLSVLYFKRLSVISLSISVVFSIFIGFILFFKYTGLQYNLKPVSLMIKDYQDRHIPIAFVGDYQGQFNFLARMVQPLPVISFGKIQQWTKQHPDGYLIFLEKNSSEQSVYTQPHRENWLNIKSVSHND